MPDANDDHGPSRASGESCSTGSDQNAPAPAGQTGEAFAVFRKALMADLARLGRWLAARTAVLGRQAGRGLTRFSARTSQSLRDTDWRGLAVATGARAKTFRANWRNRPVRRTWSVGRVASILGVVFVAGFLLLSGVAAWALYDVPFAEIAEGTGEPVVVLQAADGQALVQQGPYQGSYAPLDEFSDHLVEAVLSIEDRRFYQHWGLDFRGVARALTRNLFAGEVVQGGSTITQQFLKISYLERDRTLKRKIQEAFLAFWIETRLSKDEILARYLNNVYLGAGATGMPAAARVYFDNSVGELTLAESAMLAGLIKAPSQLNPLENLEGAKERAGVVLNAMGDAGYLEPSEIAAAKLGSTQLSPSRPDMGGGSWFADWVISDAREIAGPFRGSIEVKTTLVPELQAAAEQVVSEALATQGAEKGVGQAALVALRPDGAVVAMVGGGDYTASKFNRAVAAKRQPGSTFKLFVYYAALRAGLSPNDRIEDAPIEIDGWKPENYSGKYRGRVTLAEAFARSLNAATVRLAMDVGIDKVAAAARDLGIDADLTETPSLALGASEVTLLDLTGAYASVRVGITPIEPWGITSFAVDGAGQSFRIGPSKRPERELGPLQDPLVGLLKLVVDKGTGKAAALDGFAAGKTGTSQESRDAWFVGFNEALTVGIWVGNDDGTPMDGVTGGQLPATIWKSFMEQAAGAMQPVAAAPTAPADSAPMEPAAETPSRPASIAEMIAGESAGAPQCNVRACSRAYRSFRTSDCTFQPYRGRRKLCEK
ncbi:PBP1A family penicillin-binding protein [Aurantimonas sp. C2-6-R+9]|uniref:PBP1A family penicillin-binding protein n=1 Tax=unclassified Aurantimonas TaxID=2638230 RepID=UPI002E194A96|nr:MULTISPECIES: PBP1A family penicillin-binding protein [unclassified Aurantimonas]MEC5289586.1 PBP1A family penicillin-binding protein [Aurantimonas sp. C2-3-R2]MEC5379551.1 PBP1A family penicillin-binding protein [Aurantimonas sp. C2-6-R+9]MEC5410667.1 PBP1A family penicillin-binding protein [Aurantimonas sp. C2-4-R8]